MPKSFHSSKSLSINILTIFLFCSTCLSKIHIDISNHLPDGSPPLKVRCQSKDDDLGYHELYPNQPSYSWGFEPLWIIGDTLFFCHFWWNGKESVFDVYNQEWGSDYCIRQKRNFIFWETISNTCYWQVTADGIYMSRKSDLVNSESCVQKHDWGET